jgi:hypothetical protein
MMAPNEITSRLVPETTSPESTKQSFLPGASSSSFQLAPLATAAVSTGSTFAATALGSLSDQSVFNGTQQKKKKLLCLFLCSPAFSLALDGELQVGTDLRRWRLRVEEGRHTWHYLETDEEMARWPQNTVDKFHLGLLTERDVPTHPAPPATPLEGIQRGFEFYKLLQTEDGHWAGEYGGPLFLLPGKRVCAHVDIYLFIVPLSFFLY